MRVTIYARYSSDLQSSATIQDQVRECRERIRREGWTECRAIRSMWHTSTST